jgi:Protein of unknown function (DUF664)
VPGTGPAGPPELAPGPMFSCDASLHWIYPHMIEEYARRGGPAHLIRERIDGAVGD